MSPDEATRSSPPASSPWRLHLSALICVVILILYAALAWSAHSRKSPTYDEPYHAISSWTILRQHDFRIDFADPPLWQLYSALPNGRSSLSADFRSPHWTGMPQQPRLQWVWCVDTLYRTQGNEPGTFIARSQAMMLIVAIALGAMIATWAWRLYGPAAALVAATLFAFDPAFLGHGPLVKNDVAFTLSFLLLCYALWRTDDRPTAWRALFVAIACGLMVTIKFSGVIAAVVVPVVLLCRALSSRSWGRFETRRRLMIAFATLVLCVAISFTSIWTVYGFRFAPTPDPTLRINLDQLTEMAAVNEYAAAHEGQMPASIPAEVSAQVRLLRWADLHRLLPQAWLAGLLFTYQSALIRQAFLLGQLSSTGWWYYFPLAMGMKTPVTTIAVVLLGMTLGIWLLARMAGSRGRWTAFYVITPIAIYMASAARSNLNIGVRHVLPVYPLLMIGAGCVAAVCLRQWRRATLATLTALGIGLVTETLLAYPDYVAFFNVAAGGELGGIRLLGDSNLDWGQDLPSLVGWQHDHPRRPLYLAYFGLADPAWYGLHYTPLPGGYRYDPPPSWPSGSCTVAVSATYLQGLLIDPQLYSEFYARLAHRTPTAVLGGTIYLFDLEAR